MAAERHPLTGPARGRGSARLDVRPRPELAALIDSIAARFPDIAARARAQSAHEAAGVRRQRAEHAAKVAAIPADIRVLIDAADQLAGAIGRYGDGAACDHLITVSHNISLEQRVAVSDARRLLAGSPTPQRRP